MIHELKNSINLKSVYPIKLIFEIFHIVDHIYKIYEFKLNPRTWFDGVSVFMWNASETFFNWQILLLLSFRLWLPKNCDVLFIPYVFIQVTTVWIDSINLLIWSKSRIQQANCYLLLGQQNFQDSARITHPGMSKGLYLIFNI